MAIVTSTTKVGIKHSMIVTLAAYVFLPVRMIYFFFQPETLYNYLFGNPINISYFIGVCMAFTVPFKDWPPNFLKPVLIALSAYGLWHYKEPIIQRCKEAVLYLLLPTTALALICIGPKRITRALNLASKQPSNTRIRNRPHLAQTVTSPAADSSDLAQNPQNNRDRMNSHVTPASGYPTENTWVSSR